ncbi:MAG: DUF655 domain-containing protein [Euryarchaeota archaeon]|nr:DUF655 domain-containing protein [Euryarchaeota archaeon]
MPKLYENYAYILDYLPKGYPSERMKRSKSSVAQAVGESYFSLLEVAPRTEMEINERVFIGKGKREKVSHIKKRLFYDDLTSAAKAELPYLIAKIVKGNEERFVTFFNNAGSLSIRFHKLQLLPGVGKKLMSSILKERKKEKFKSFKEIDERVSSMPDPTEMIVERIIDELKGKDRYTVFAPLRKIKKE